MFAFTASFIIYCKNDRSDKKVKIHVCIADSLVKYWFLLFLFLSILTALYGVAVTDNMQI